MTSYKADPRARVVVEGVVIVGSILLPSELLARAEELDPRI